MSDFWNIVYQFCLLSLNLQSTSSLLTFKFFYRVMMNFNKISSLDHQRPIYKNIWKANVGPYIFL